MRRKVATWIGPATLLALGTLLGALAGSAGANHSATAQVSRGQINGNGVTSSTFSAASADGSRVFFVTTEQLVSADTDGALDIYERSNFTTTLMSTGPAGGNGAFTATFSAISQDGAHVLFITSEQLVAADTDSAQDIYDRSGGTTTLISTGPTGGNGGFSANFSRSSQDGSRVFFATTESLVLADTDTSQDLYQRSGGTTTLLSTGPAGGSGAFAAFFLGLSQDGTRAFFSTDEQLVSGDTDSSSDIYERAGGTTTLISTGSTGGNGPFSPAIGGVSQDGTRVFFFTAESLVAGDTDSVTDVYERSGATTTRISTGPTGGNGALSAVFLTSSADGTHALFATSESLVAADTDSVTDFYDRTGGTTTLVTAGQINGNGAFPANAYLVSADASHVFFTTSEPLTTSDTDSQIDVYERSGGVTTHVSIAPNGGNGALDANVLGVSQDGTRVFFSTAESLVSADTDAVSDIYERAQGITTRISTGTNGGNSGATPIFRGISPDGSKVFINTQEPLEATDTDTASDVYLIAAFPLAPYPIPQSASTISVAFVPAFRQTISATQCASTGRTATTHGAPFSVTSCNPPALPGGTVAFFGRAAFGTATLSASPGSPLPGSGEADQGVYMGLSDIRTGSVTGADYDPNPTGDDITLVAKLRISDLYNGGSLTSPGTAADVDLAIPVFCSQNANVDIGAGCSLESSVNSVYPGGIAKGHQTVLDTFRVRLNDSGANGIRGDSDDRNFAMQGTYLP